MNTTLWIVQVILSVMMLLLGFMKTFLPMEQLNKFAWTKRNSTELVRFIGISEILIGIGLVLPQYTGILPILSSLAAYALFIVMLLAIAEHLRHREIREIWKNVIILFMAAFVAVGRLVLFQL